VGPTTVEERRLAIHGHHVGSEARHLDLALELVVEAPRDLVQVNAAIGRVRRDDGDRPFLRLARIVHRCEGGGAQRASSEDMRETFLYRRVVVEQLSERRLEREDTLRFGRGHAGTSLRRRGQDSFSAAAHLESRQGPRSAGHHSGTYTPHATPQNDEDPAICRAFVEAAEETRTLDLLHGKQTL
jgi:hypothetical protein